MTSWADYVTRVARTDVSTEIAEATGINQSSVHRWLKKNASPSTAHAARFAQVYGRNVLEAFVAADFLTPAEAHLPESAPADSRQLEDGELVNELASRLTVLRNEVAQSARSRQQELAHGSAVAGGELRYWRNRRGLTQTDLAKQLGVPQAHVASWERGRTLPDITQIWQLAASFGISVEQLAERLSRVADGRFDAVAETITMDSNRAGRGGRAMTEPDFVVRLNGNPVMAGQVDRDGSMSVVIREGEAARAITLDLSQARDSWADQLVKQAVPPAIALEFVEQVAERLTDRGLLDDLIPTFGHDVAASDPGQPSQYERATSEQDASYDVNQDERTNWREA